MLTDHQKLHLDAALERVKRDRAESQNKKESKASKRGLLKTEYESYIDEMETKAKEVLSTGIFPKDLEPREIHDYLHGYKQDS
jgi:hypothetical protein